MGLRFLLILSLLGLSLYTPQTYAQSTTVDDGFEPFADYSEFVEANTEETDVNFFKYGRLLSLGVGLGQKTLTDKQRNLVDDSLEFSFFVSFYIAINFAFQAGYQTSSHDVFFEVKEIDSNFEGTTRHDNFFLHAKYTLNTQNLTKATARFNPYLIGGVSQFYRETRSPNIPFISARDGAPSFDFGAGLERLFNHNKNFIGLQLMYHYVSFPNENDPILVSNQITGEDVDTGLRFKGDLWSMKLNVGFNF